MSPRATAVLAVFVGPAAAAADQVASYFLVYPAQAHGDKTLLHAVTLAAAIVVVVGGSMSYGVLRRKTEVFEVDRFVALAGLVLNAFFLLVVLAGYGLPKLLLHPTD